MERKTRRKFSADFKTKVVIEALKERSTLEQLSKKYELLPNQITNWKKEFLANASLAFSGESEKSKGESAPEVDKLYAQIGQLTVENNWLKKKLN
jgi:transposase